MALGGAAAALTRAWYPSFALVRITRTNGVTCVRLFDDGKDYVAGNKTFGMAAGVLRDVYSAWVEGGRSKDFSPAGLVGGTFSNVFLYINPVTVQGTNYQCRFGLEMPYGPPGVLAITDDGTVVWIRARDKQVTVSPQTKTIEL